MQVAQHRHRVHLLLLLVLLLLQLQLVDAAGAACGRERRGGRGLLLRRDGGEGRAEWDSRSWVTNGRILL